MIMHWKMAENATLKQEIKTDLLVCRKGAFVIS